MAAETIITSFRVSKMPQNSYYHTNWNVKTEKGLLLLRHIIQCIICDLVQNLISTQMCIDIYLCDVDRNRTTMLKRYFANNFQQHFWLKPQILTHQLYIMFILPTFFFKVMKAIQSVILVQRECHGLMVKALGLQLWD